MNLFLTNAKFNLQTVGIIMLHTTCLEFPDF